MSRNQDPDADQNLNLYFFVVFAQAPHFHGCVVLVEMGSNLTGFSDSSTLLIQCNPLTCTDSSEGKQVLFLVCEMILKF